MNKHKNSIWCFYENTHPEEKMATCNFCSNAYSYKSSTGNLRNHLLAKHQMDYLKINTEHRLPKPRERALKVNNPLWNYFERDPKQKTGVCNLCHNTFSYLSTTGNLKSHLQKKHQDAYGALLKELARAQSKTHFTDDDADGDDQDEAEASPAAEGAGAEAVWSYFEREAGGRARCVVCRAALRHDAAELRRHLRGKHPRLLPRDTPETDDDDRNDETALEDDSYEGSNAKEEVYTEIVYLEENTDERQRKYAATPEGKRRKKHGLDAKDGKRRVDKKLKKRRASDSSDDRPVFLLKSDKPASAESKPAADEDEDLDNFGKYVTSLLKRIPRELATKLQMDIVNLIMSAKLNYEVSQKNETMMSHAAAASHAEEAPSGDINATAAFEFPQKIEPIIVETVDTTPNHGFTIAIPPPTETTIDTDDRGEPKSLPLLTSTPRPETIRITTNVNAGKQMSNVTAEHTARDAPDREAVPPDPVRLNSFSSHGYSFSVSRNPNSGNVNFKNPS